MWNHTKHIVSQEMDETFDMQNIFHLKIRQEVPSYIEIKSKWWTFSNVKLSNSNYENIGTEMKLHIWVIFIILNNDNMHSQTLAWLTGDWMHMTPGDGTVIIIMLFFWQSTGSTREWLSCMHPLHNQKDQAGFNYQARWR